MGDNWVYRIYCDKDDIIWIASNTLPWQHNSKGLTRFNPLSNKFTVFKQDSSNLQSFVDYVLSIYEDQNNNLWIGTKKGVFHFDRKKEEFIPFIPNSKLTEEFVNSIFVSIKEDTKGNLWFGTINGSVYKLEKDKNKLVFFEYTSKNDLNSPPGSAEQILVDPIDKEQIWFISYGIHKYNTVSNNFTRIDHDPDNSSSLSSYFLNSMHLDNTGNYWFTLNSGINILNIGLNHFDHFKVCQTSICDKEIEATAFYEDENGFLWIGTRMAGLICYDTNMNKIDGYNTFPIDEIGWADTYVTKIYGDSKNNLWIGCSGAGINLINNENKEINHCNFIDETGNEEYRFVIREIFEDSKEVIWIGTWKGLYFKTNDQKGITDFQVCEFDPLNSSDIRCIIEDKSGNIWVGTARKGIFTLSPENRNNLIFKNYKFDPTDPNSLFNDGVMSIVEDDSGTIWIGTESGLNKYNKKQDNFDRINEKFEFPAQYIYKISYDNSGYLWMSTEKGLLRFNPYADKVIPIKLFEKRDGIPFESIYSFSLFKNKNGKMYVGGEKGVFSFYPDSIKDNTHIPPIVLTNFNIKNKDVKLDSSITAIKKINLSHSQNFFSFNFAALDYTNPEKNQYAYYLQWLEENWIYSGTRRFANYTDVKPGEYVFHVKGSNNDGYWNETGASVHISIAPPYWKTWWAYTLYVIFIVGLIYSLRRYELKRQHLKQDLELEHVEADKLKELDKMKSRFFANISHEFRTPLTLILGPLEKLKSKYKDQESEKDLNIMQGNARRLQNLINQLLNLSRLESGKMKLKAREENIVSLVNGYVQSFESLAKQKNINFNFKSQEDENLLFVDKDKIQKILYNLLSNAFKFTGEGGRIEVIVTPLPPSRGENAGISPLEGGLRGVTIKISDTGPGIPPNQLEHVFNRFYQTDDSYTKDQEGSGIGLALTKELVELHHGEINVESVEGKGTTFSFVLPGGKNHLKPEEIVNGVDLLELDSLEELEEQSFENLDEVNISDDVSDEKDSKPLLLIVEDNDDLRSYIRSCLPDEYNVSEAIDGEMGLEKAIEKIPDLILSDVMMPKMDGMQLCKKIKSDERTSHIPIILLTAKAGLKDKLEGLETGADDFISKPFEVDELLIRIKNLIGQRQKLRELFSEKITSPESFVQKLQDCIISTTDQKFLQKANEVVNECLQDYDFGAELFSTKMNMSRMQLHRKLKAIVNQSAGDFIRTIRLNRAASLLEAEFGNVTEVSLEVGFNNLSWFTKCFKEQFGVLPSEYRGGNSKA